MKKSRQKRKEIEGKISVSSKGVGYVKTPDYEEDVEIDTRFLNTALHGDKVRMSLLSKTGGRMKGEITEILSRAKRGFAGVLEKEKGIFYLKPDDGKMYADILIPEKFLNQAKPGEKVFVKIVSWKDPKKAPEGKVSKILGHPGENEAQSATCPGRDSSVPGRAARGEMIRGAPARPRSGIFPEVSPRRTPRTDTERIRCVFVPLPNSSFETMRLETLAA